MEFFHLKSLRYLKKINDIFRLKGIFDFSHLQLTPLEPNLTVVAWREKKVGTVALKSAELF